MSRFIDKTSVQYNNNPKDLILYDDKIVLADDKKESVFLLSNLNKAIVSGSKIKFKNVIGFRFQTNEDASKYCEIINNLISNWHNNNFNSNEEAHHDKQNLAKGKQYCRICNAEISTGTLCSECLKTANEELLTVAERKQRNEKIDSERCLFVCFGIVSVIMGIFIILYY